MAEMNSDDQSLKRQVNALTQQAADLKAKKLQMQSAASDQVKAQVQTINDKKARMIDADKKQRENASNTAKAESTYPLDDNIIVEATTSDSNTFKHNGKDHALKIKDMKSSHAEFELHHDGSKWDLSNDSKKAYPHTSKAITATGFLNKVNKQWKTPSGNMSKDIQLGNVYHTHKDAEPINTHYGQDLKTNYIQVTGAGFYHTGNDEAKLGSPELVGKTDFRASMNKRKAKNGKYSASVIMALKDPKKSMHCLDAPLKEYTTMLQVIESRNNADALWDKAEEHLASANKHKGNKEAYHFHMSNHHDVKSQYHADLGQHRQSDVHADKAEEHHDKSLQAAHNGLAESEEIWVSESSLNPKDPHKDYQEKSKVLQGLMLNKDVDQKHVGQRRLDLDKEYAKIKESDEAWAASLEKKKEDHLTPNDKDKLDKVRAMLAKEKKPVKETKYWSKTGKTAKHNETGEETHEYAEYDDEKGDATGKREYRNAKGKSMGESVEQIEEASRTETGELFKSLVDRAHTSSEDGNHSQAKRHLANAQTARYGITHQHMAKHKASFDKYKELKHAYTNSDEHVREETELEEAHKIHDKVEIIKGSAKGTRGHIGEIRHGAFKGAPKQYTVYHGEHDATQVSKEHIRAIKESDEAWAASLEKKKEERLTPNDKDKLDKVRAMLAKEKKPVKETKYWSKTGKTAKHNETGEETHEYAEYDDEKGDATGKREYRNAKGKSMGESVEQIEEASRTETGELFKSLVDRAHTSSEDGNHSQAKRHLANAQTARYGITHQHMAKHKASFDKYKELKHAYTNSDEHVREETELEEAHKIHDKVEIIKGSAKGTRGHIGEIRHGAFKGAPKQYTVYHGEHDATQVSKEHIRAIKEAVDVMANLRQAHDRHMAKALTANKGGDDAAVKVHQVYMQKIQAKMQKLKRNEETMNEDVEQIDEISKELAGNYYGKVNQQHVKKVGVKPNMYDRVEKDLGKKRKEGLDRAFNRLTKEETMNEEHLIHVSDGSKYGDKPSKKDIDHVMAGVKAHNGEHDGSSDKGAFFKFKSHTDAENFKRHVDKCPGKTCYADHTESTEFTTSSLDETWSKEQLANIKSLHTKMSKSVGLDPTKKYGTIITKSKKDREMDKAIKDEMNEISNATLTSYKQKAGEQASAADKAGDFKKGNKRFSGIVKATKKQFANDLKKEDLDESRGHKVIATFFKNRKSWNKAASERDAKHDEIEKKRQAEKAAGKENMSSAIDRLAKHVNEEGEGGVAANNAGDGKIAGFTGDAGKKAVMSKKILQRKTLGDFKKFVSQEHDEN